MKKLMCIVLLLTGFANLKAQTNYEIPITFTVSQNGINRFLAAQWEGITHSWSGTTNGISYNISLERPQISLMENQLKIALTLNVASSVYNGRFSLMPTLDIPAATLSAANIAAEYTNLRAQIDAVTGLVSIDLRNKIQEVLEPIDWIMSQGQALPISTGRIVTTSELRWAELPTLSYGISEGEISFTITPKISARAPYFQAKWKMGGNDKTLQVRIYSKNEFSLHQAMGLQWSDLQGNDYSVTPSQMPVSSQYSSEYDDYYAEYSYTSNYTLPAGHYYFKVMIRRGTTESLWVVPVNYDKDTSWPTTRALLTGGAGAP